MYPQHRGPSNNNSDLTSTRAESSAAVKSPVKTWAGLFAGAKQPTRGLPISTSQNHTTEPPTSSGAQQQCTQPAGSCGVNSVAEQLLREARKSTVDHLTGKIKCRSCGKPFESYRFLAQHLQAKHNGVNSDDFKFQLLRKPVQQATKSASKALPSLGQFLVVKTQPRSSQKPASALRSSQTIAHRRSGGHPAPAQERSVLLGRKLRIHTVAGKLKRGGITRTAPKKPTKTKRLVLQARANSKVHTSKTSLLRAKSVFVSILAEARKLAQELCTAQHLQASSMIGSETSCQSVQVLHLACSKALQHLNQARNVVVNQQQTFEARLQEQSGLLGKSMPPPTDDANLELTGPLQEADKLLAQLQPASSSAEKLAAAHADASQATSKSSPSDMSLELHLETLKKEAAVSSSDASEGFALSSAYERRTLPNLLPYPMKEVERQEQQLPTRQSSTGTTPDSGELSSAAEESYAAAQVSAVGESLSETSSYTTDSDAEGGELRGWTNSLAAWANQAQVPSTKRPAVRAQVKRAADQEASPAALAEGSSQPALLSAAASCSVAAAPTQPKPEGRQQAPLPAVAAMPAPQQAAACAAPPPRDAASAPTSPTHSPIPSSQASMCGQSRESSSSDEERTAGQADALSGWARRGARSFMPINTAVSATAEPSLEAGLDPTTPPPPRPVPGARQLRRFLSAGTPRISEDAAWQEPPSPGLFATGRPDLNAAWGARLAAAPWSASGLLAHDIAVSSTTSSIAGDLPLLDPHQGLAASTDSSSEAGDAAAQQPETLMGWPGSSHQMHNLSPTQPLAPTGGRGYGGSAHARHASADVASLLSSAGALGLNWPSTTSAAHINQLPLSASMSPSIPSSSGRSSPVPAPSPHHPSLLQASPRDGFSVVPTADVMNLLNAWQSGRPLDRIPRPALHQQLRSTQLAAEAQRAPFYMGRKQLQRGLSAPAYVGPLDAEMAAERQRQQEELLHLLRAMYPNADHAALGMSTLIGAEMASPRGMSEQHQMSHGLHQLPYLDELLHAAEMHAADLGAADSAPAPVAAAPGAPSAEAINAAAAVMQQLIDSATAAGAAAQAAAMQIPGSHMLMGGMQGQQGEQWGMQQQDNSPRGWPAELQRSAQGWPHGYPQEPGSGQASNPLRPGSSPNPQSSGGIRVAPVGPSSQLPPRPPRGPQVMAQQAQRNLMLQGQGPMRQVPWTQRLGYGDLSAGAAAWQQPQQQQQQQQPSPSLAAERLGLQQWAQQQASAAAQANWHAFQAGQQVDARALMAMQASALSLAGTESYPAPAPAPGARTLNRSNTFPLSRGSLHQRADSEGSESLDVSLLGPATETLQLLSQSVAAGSPAPLPVPGNGGTELHCNVCNITCNSVLSLQQHMASRRHLQRAAQSVTAALDAAAQELESLNGSGPKCSAATGSSAVRAYCTQAITLDLNNVAIDILQKLCMFQERAISKNPTKGAAKKLYVCGLREVRRAVRLKRARSVVLAPNIEEVEVEGGLSETVQALLDACKEAEVPVVFALSRKKLGAIYGFRKRMSAVALLDVSGVREQHDELLALADAGREAWSQGQAGNAAEAEGGDGEDEGDEQQER